MNKNISIFKKIKVFNNFNKTISENETELEQVFNVRIDKAKRLYTVLNIPEDVIGEPYNVRKGDIDKIAEKYIKEYSMKLSQFLDSKGLNETYKYYEVSKVDKYSYLIIIGFSLFQSNKYYNNLYYKVIPITILVIILSLFFILR